MDATLSSSRKRGRGSEDDCSVSSSLDNVHSTGGSHGEHQPANTRRSLVQQLQQERACVLEHRLHLEAQLADLMSFQEGSGEESGSTASFLEDLQGSIQASLQQDQVLAGRLADLERAGQAAGVNPLQQQAAELQEQQALDATACKQLLENGLTSLDIDAHRTHLVRRKRRRLETRQRVVHWLEAACPAPSLDAAPVEPAC